jgi:acyl carrier protein
MENIFEKVKQVHIDKLGLAGFTIEPTTNYKNDLNIDSLDKLEIIMEIEKEFKIHIADEDVEKLNTVGELADFVTDKVMESP